VFRPVITTVADVKPVAVCQESVFATLRFAGQRVGGSVLLL
jgi:hypothetical protein